MTAKKKTPTKKVQHTVNKMRVAMRPFLGGGHKQPTAKPPVTVGPKTVAAATKAPPHRFKEEKTLPLAVVEAAKEMLPRLREGSTISAERTKYGFNDNTMLRLALRELLGPDEYKKLIEQMTAVRITAARAAGKRPGGTRAPVAPAVDDKDVPVLTAPEGKDDWKSRTMTIGRCTEKVFVSPEGLEYVRASANQRADIIYQPKTAGLSPARWRLLETSTQAKTVRREEKIAVARKNSKLAKKKVQRKK